MRVEPSAYVVLKAALAVAIAPHLAHAAIVARQSPP